MRILLLLLLFVGGSGAAAGQPLAALPDIGAPDDKRIAAVAGQLQRGGSDFDRIFSELLAAVLQETATNAHVRLDDRIRSVFGGLWIWGTGPGRPALQRRQDWALHFIGGGAFEGYWDAGTTAGLIKEQADARDPYNRYDLDDLTATMLGARWVDLATTNSAAAARRWVQAWASRRLTINASLPKLQFGQLPKGKQASAEAIVKVWRFVQDGMKPLPP